MIGSLAGPGVMGKYIPTGRSRYARTNISQQTSIANLENDE